MGTCNFPYSVSSLKHFSFPLYKDSVWTLGILEVLLEEVDFESLEGV